MVVERFRNGDADAVRARFKKDGRLMPEGLIYLSSWIDHKGEVCYQLMESADPELFALWTSKWSDLVDFEITPVMAAADFWTQREGGK